MVDIISTILSAVLTCISTYILWVVKQGNTNKKANKNGMKVLMRRELRTIHDECMSKHKITDEELAEFNEIYEVYTACGGNGRGPIWKKDLENLPRVSDD